MKINITDDEIFYLEMLGNGKLYNGCTLAYEKQLKTCRKIVSKYKRAKTLNMKKYNKENY